MKRTRYRHRFLIPVIAMSVSGTAARAVCSAVRGDFGMEVFAVACICLAGTFSVYIGGQRAYRWLVFRHFTAWDKFRYVLLLILSGLCLAVSAVCKHMISLIISGAIYLMLSLWLRFLFISIRRRNLYVGAIPRELGIHVR